MPISIGISVVSVGRVSITSIVNKLLGRCGVSTHLLRIRVARDTITGGLPIIGSAVHGLRTENVIMLVSSFNSTCSSLGVLGSVGISIVGLSAGFVRLDSRGTNGNVGVVRSVVIVTGGLRLVVVTRNTRAGRRIS